MTAADTSPPVEPMVPKDAATLVVVDRAGAAPRLLMGRRNANLVFLANKFVFPGGRVDDEDHSGDAVYGDLQAEVVEKLLVGMRGEASRERARAFAITAVRELKEETGLVLGSAEQPPLPTLAYFARAITPPGRPRRFDTRFFMADAALIGDRTLAGDGELGDLSWFTLGEAAALDLPNITRLIIEDIAQVLRPAVSARPASIPFYYHSAGTFHRDLI